MTFGIQDILIFSGALQGLFLVFALWKMQNRNPAIIRSLSLFLLLTTLTLTGRLFFMGEHRSMSAQLGLVLDSVIFVFGPLLYTYLRQATYGEKLRNSWVHFLPLSIHLSIAFYYFSQPETQFLEQLITGLLNSLFTAIEFSALILNSYYIIQSFRLLIKYKADEAKALSYKHKLVAYLQSYLFAISICLVGWWASFFTSTFIGFHLAIIGYDSVWTGIAISSYIIGYFCLTEPEIFKLEVVSENKGLTQRLSQDEIDRLTPSIEEALHQDQIYLDPKLTLVVFAKKIEAKPHDVSWLLNNVYHKSFYDFINYHRVKAFLEKVENREHEAKTILALSYEVGFHSKSTFNKAFKIEKNDTPSQYIKRLQASFSK